ncbi:hypothetical protein DAPPUDRAFT_244873 [Daphnia pulex]|uniref:Uncharacterized protein n=1 Tax=Daphnia pulex TaxID=6669 RepID=E9GM16_DAPPU|nr:hypothetical protein DAPPUDRAFT_244873 [Daphnia pulex]|eukprot:EFX79466.1 hypothetical protein DAPPUDRAFT_244873 [Daphnia pulex]
MTTQETFEPWNDEPSVVVVVSFLSATTFHLNRTTLTIKKNVRIWETREFQPATTTSRQTVIIRQFGDVSRHRNNFSFVGRFDMLRPTCSRFQSVNPEMKLELPSSTSQHSDINAEILSMSRMTHSICRATFGGQMGPVIYDDVILSKPTNASARNEIFQLATFAGDI